MKKLTKDLVRRARALGATERIEHWHTVGQASLPPSAARLLRRLIPQPRDYADSTVRRVVRYGLELELRPHHFHQWLHYFQLEDPVRDRLVTLATSADVVFDVGANIGLYSLSMAAAGARQVHAFEPHPRTAAWLARNLELNPRLPVRAHSVAVADRVDHAFLGTDYETSDAGKYSLVSSTGEIRVPTTTLDHFANEHGLSRLDLLKIDVEGAEGIVLAGALSVISDARPAIVVEVSSDMRAASQDARPILRRIEREWGYEFRDVRSGKKRDVETLVGYHNLFAERPAPRGQE